MASSKAYISTLKYIRPVVKNQLDTICSEAKETMKKIDSSEVASWKNVVTTGDASWLTRGYFFAIRNCNYSKLHVIMPYCTISICHNRAPRRSRMNLTWAHLNLLKVLALMSCLARPLKKAWKLVHMYKTLIPLVYCLSENIFLTNLFILEC